MPNESRIDDFTRRHLKAYTEKRNPTNLSAEELEEKMIAYLDGLSEDEYEYHLTKGWTFTALAATKTKP